MTTVALIDYKAGNLTSVRKALAAIGAEVYTPERAGDLARADGVIVPGVGHFNATASLDDEWRAAVRARVDEGRPLLGICLGLQWLFEGSDEAPALPGLGLLPGRCHLLDAGGQKVPHVGWNTVDIMPASAVPAGAVSAGAVSADAAPPGAVPAGAVPTGAVPEHTRALRGVTSGTYAYFTHSYVAPVTAACVATTTHGERFAAVVERDHVMGVQFHPEKSGEVGLAILRNFVALAEERREGRG